LFLFLIVCFVCFAKMKYIIAVIILAIVAASVNGDNVRFKDKVVLVTGGTSGIGYQTALQFAQEGARVIICARDSQKEHYSGADAVKKITDDEVVKKNGGTVRFVQTDVTNSAQVKALFDDIRAQEKTLDIAVNNAGISGPRGKLDETAKYTYTQYDPIINNVYGVMNCIAEEEAMMFKNGINGSIVNVAAVHGITPDSHYPLYSASKYAIIGLGNSVALNHIDGANGTYIRVNNVAPSTVATPFAFNRVKACQPWEGDWITEDSQIWQEALPSVVEHIPMSRVGRPNEVANTILWLCTEDAIHISGDTITVDGGYWAV